MRNLWQFDNKYDLSGSETLMAHNVPLKKQEGSPTARDPASEDAAMTSNQYQAVWELCRQGLPLAADEAAQHWDQGHPFELDSYVRIARSVEVLIEQCNWEVERLTESA